MTTKVQRVNALLARQIDWDVPAEAVRMIATEEDCRLTAYRCTAGKPTCGWGETDGVRMGMTWTQDQADERLRLSLSEWGAAVRGMLTEYAGPNQLTALLCLSYNIGLAGLRGSTVLRKHNAGDYAAAARAFGLWNKETRNGKLVMSDALTARRAREAAIYLTPDDENEPVAMPQAVQAESRLIKSPIAASGAVAAGTGVVSIIGQAGDQIGSIGATVQTARATVVDTLGVPEGAFLPLVLVAAGGIAVYWRWKQRTGGWC